MFTLNFQRHDAQHTCQTNTALTFSQCPSLAHKTGDQKATQPFSNSQITPLRRAIDSLLDASPKPEPSMIIFFGTGYHWLSQF